MFLLPTTRGTHRHVFIFNKFVIKVPRISAWWEFSPDIEQFKENLHLNKMEMELCKKHAGEKGIPKLYFGGVFGLLIIMKRYQQFEDREEYVNKLSALIEKSSLPREFWEDDAHMNNFGFDSDGSIVKIDLG